MKADRLLSVLLLMQARGRVTERELAERLEVSQRTIHRDLEALSASRVPVTALRGSQGGWELAKGWRTQVPGLDESELRALLMAQPRVVGHPRLAAAAESALNKLMAALPGPMREQAAAMRERLHIDPTGWWQTGEDLSMLSIVQDAVARERQLAFDYVRADGQRSARTVDPLGLVAKGTSWYLVARGGTGLRTFRVSRMTGATVLASGFDRPAKFNLAAYWARATAELEDRRETIPGGAGAGSGGGADDRLPMPDDAGSRCPRPAGSSRRVGHAARRIRRRRIRPLRRAGAGNPGPGHRAGGIPPGNCARSEERGWAAWGAAEGEKRAGHGVSS